MTSSSSKSFYIINTENKQQMKIGRGQDCDVRITDDISVSRCHAIIRKTSKGMFVTKLKYFRILLLGGLQQ